MAQIAFGTEHYYFRVCVCWNCIISWHILIFNPISKFLMQNYSNVPNRSIPSSIKHSTANNFIFRWWWCNKPTLQFWILSSKGGFKSDVPHHPHSSPKVVNNTYISSTSKNTSTSLYLHDVHLNLLKVIFLSLWTKTCFRDICRGNICSNKPPDVFFLTLSLFYMQALLWWFQRGFWADRS